jgi:hypothetical protein
VIRWGGDVVARAIGGAVPSSDEFLDFPCRPPKRA